jgi:GWxTD domain-containing protein
MLKSLFLLLCPVILSAQIQFIPVSGDYASFHATDSLAYLEIYASIFQGSLKYTQEENGSFRASFSSSLKLTNSNGFEKKMTHKYQNSFEDTLSAHKYNQFVDIFAMEVPYGKYKAILDIVDNTSMKKGQYIFEFNTIQPAENLFLSDIELCSSIKMDTVKSSLYYKNGLSVIPNPRRTFDILQPMLYFYVELNNLEFQPDEPGKYEFSYAITTNTGDTVKSRKKIEKDIAGNKLVEIGALNVMALSHDAYFVNVLARDENSNTEVTGRKLFQVYKPVKKEVAHARDVNQIVTGIYGQFTKEDLEHEFEVARYLANRDEKKVFEKLDNAEAMKSFLAAFWNRKDEQYDSGAGNFRKIYMNRVELANQRFRTMGRDGWKTDRGRVLLIYGEPDEYERFPNSMDALPYIIWHYYDLDGAQIFVFTDMDGFGDYRQIHSTYRKELQNPGWENIINKSGGSSDFDY